MEGIFAIFKNKGPTSHDIIDELRLITKIRKIGHAGTLDPLAEGVLVVGIGSIHTKNLNYYLKKEKKYLALIELGKESTTDDEEGTKKIIKINKKPGKNEIKMVISNFEGKIKQKPPIFSAVKINGTRAYKLARLNQNVKMNFRNVEIKKIKIIKYNYPELLIEVTTGPGVYIRSLARDIGKKLNTGGYLKNLTRTKVGNFTLDNALTISQFSKIIKNL